MRAPSLSRALVLAASTTVFLVTATPNSGCQVDFFECRDDVDCNTGKTGTGKTLHCTRDHLCVTGSPLEFLCTEPYPRSAPDDAIVIGALVNRDYGNDALLLKSYQMAIDELNSVRPRPARPLKLLICEINSDLEDPYKSMQRLAREPNLVAVVGPTNSRDVLAIQTEVIARRIPIVSPGATSPEISLIGDGEWPVNGLFFRVVPSDTLQGPILARIAVDEAEDNRNIGMLYVDDSYGRGLKNAVVAHLEKHGRVVRPVLAYDEPIGGVDRQSIDKQVGLLFGNGPVDIIAIPNRRSVNVIESIAQHTAAARNLRHIIMGEGGKNETVLSLASRNDEQILYALRRLSGSAPASNTEHKHYQQFQMDFLRFSNFDANSTVFTASAYDAIYAISLAVGAAEPALSPSRVAAMLSRINGCLTTPGLSRRISVGKEDYSAGRHELATQSAGVVLDGLSGEICFTAHGDRVDGNYEKWWVEVERKRFDQRPTLP